MKSLKEKQRWGIRKFTNGVGSKLLGLTIVGMSLTAMSTTTFADEVTQPTTNDPVVVNTVEATEVQPTTVETTQPVVTEIPVVTENAAAEVQPIVSESEVDATVTNTDPAAETQPVDAATVNEVSEPAVADVNEVNETPAEPVALEGTTNEEPVMAMAAVATDENPNEVSPTSVELVTDPDGAQYIEIVLPDYEQYADGSTVTLTMDDYNHNGISKQLIRLGSSTVATVTTEDGPNTFVNNIHEEYIQTGIADITTADLETYINNFTSSIRTTNLVITLNDNINAVAINRKLRIAIDTSLDNNKLLTLSDRLKVPLGDGAKWNAYLNTLGAVNEGTLSYNGTVLDTQTVTYKLFAWPSSDGNQLKLADPYGPGIYASSAASDPTPNANVVSEVNGIAGIIAYHLGGTGAEWVDGEGTSEAHTYQPGELSFSMSIGDGSIYKLKDGLTNSTVTQSRVTTLPTTTSIYSDDGSVFRRQSTTVTTEDVEWDITVDYDTNTVTFSNKNVLDIEKEDGLRMFSVVSRSSIGNGFFDYFELKDEFESMVDIATLTAPLELTLTATDDVVNKTFTEAAPTANVLLSNSAAGDAVGTILVENIDGDTGEIISTRVVTENTIWSDKYSDSPEPIINDYTYARMADDSAVKEGFVGSGTRTIKYIYYNLTPAVTVEEVPPTTVYQPSLGLPLREQQEIDPGQPGSITTTTTYEIVDGQKVATTGEPVVVDAQPRVVNVGNYNEFTEQTPYSTVYRENPELTAGDQVLVENGQDGSIVYTDTYDVDPATGELSGPIQSTVVTDPVNEIIEVGTKPVVEKEPIPFETETVYDDTIFPEESYTRTNGVEGETITTTTYTVDPVSGEVTPSVATETVDPTTEVRVVGTKTQTVENTPIPYETIYVENPYLPNSERNVITPGEDGNIQTVTTNGVPVETRTKEPVAEIIEIGTLPIVETTSVEPSSTYVENPELPHGEQNEVDPGTNEVTTTTTTFTVISNTGEVLINTTTDVTPGTPKVIEVGTKPVVEVTTKDPSVTYVENPELPNGEQNEVDPGAGEVTTVTTTYSVDPYSGEVTPNTTTEVTPETPKVIEVGTKPIVEVTAKEPSVTYVENPDLLNGQRNEIDPGTDEVTTVTTTFTVNPDTGEVTHNTTTEVTPETPKVIEVGTKPYIEKESIPFETETIYDDTLFPEESHTSVFGVEGEITTTTTYTVDPISGEVTPNVTTETVDPITEVRVVGIKTQTTENTPIPYETTYVENPELPNGEQNVVTPGEEGNTQTVTTNGTPVETVTKEPVTEVIEVGTKPSVVITTKDPSVTYVENPELPNGEQNETNPGEGEVITTTTTYTVDPKTGEVTPNTTTEVTPETPKVIEVGTKPTIDVSTKDPSVTYVENPELPNGEQNETNPGNGEVTTTTTTYTVDPNTGEVTPNTTTEVTPETPKVIEVGTKPSVEVSTKDPSVTYVENPDLPNGEQNEVTPGNGEVTTTTTTYTVDPNTGEVTPNTTTEVTPETPKVIEVGTKPVVEVTTEDPTVTYVENPELPNGEQNETPGKGKTTTTTTTYTVDPKTGEVTPNVTTTTEDGTPAVVEVGTKPTIEVSTKDPSVTYVENPELPNGEQNETSPGNGEVTTTTTTYTVDPNTGEVTPNTTTEVTPETPKVIEVGTKPTVEKESIPFETEVIYDDTIFPEGSYTKVPGVDGEATTTTTYTVDSNTGEVTPNATTEIKDPTTEVKVVGTKTATVTEETVPHKTVYVENPDTPVGTRTVTQQGEDGVKTITTTNGNPVEEITKEPTDTIVEVGTKPTIETDVDEPTVTYVENPGTPVGTRDETPGKGKTTTTTTTYTVDPNTGEVTPNVTTTTEDGTPTVVEVGTKPSVDKGSIPYDTEVVYDDTLLPNESYVKTPGQNGEKTTTTRYGINHETGEVLLNTMTETVDPITEIRVVGTKTVAVETEVTPHNTVYVENPELPAGDKVVKVQGQDGLKTITTTNGQSSVVITKTPVDTVIEVGTKPVVSVTTTPPEITYVANPDLPVGTRNETPGKGEVTTTTTSYTVDKDGNLVPQTSTSVTPGTATVIEIGTKTTVSEEVIPHGEVVKEDPTLPVGETKVIPGKDGKTITTTTYTIDENGELVPHVNTTTEDGVDTIKLVGTKETEEVKETEKPSEDKPEVKEAEKTAVEQPVAQNTVVESPKVIADTNTNQNVDNQKELPNTGEESNNLGIIGAMMLGLLGFVGIKRRKKD